MQDKGTIITENLFPTKNGKFNWLSLIIEIVKATLVWVTANAVN